MAKSELERENQEVSETPSSKECHTFTRFAESVLNIKDPFRLISASGVVYKLRIFNASFKLVFIKRPNPDFTMPHVRKISRCLPLFIF